MKSGWALAPPGSSAMTSLLYTLHTVGVGGGGAGVDEGRPLNLKVPKIVRPA